MSTEHKPVVRPVVRISFDYERRAELMNHLQAHGGIKDLMSCLCDMVLASKDPGLTIALVKAGRCYIGVDSDKLPNAS